MKYKNFKTNYKSYTNIIKKGAKQSNEKATTIIDKSITKKKKEKEETQTYQNTNLELTNKQLNNEMLILMIAMN